MKLSKGIYKIILKKKSKLDFFFNCTFMLITFLFKLIIYNINFSFCFIFSVTHECNILAIIALVNFAIWNIVIVKDIKYFTSIKK